MIVEILDTNDLIFHVKYIFFVSAHIYTFCGGCGGSNGNTIRKVADGLKYEIPCQ